MRMMGGGYVKGMMGMWGRGGILEILAVDHMNTAVNDRLFHRLQALFAAYHQFTQRKNKVRFQSQRIVLLTVIAVDVHGVDILSAGGPMWITCPCRRSTSGAYSASGSQMIISSSVTRKALAISRFARNFCRAGSAQNQPFGFFSFLRSTMIRLLDRAFSRSTAILFRSGTIPAW